MKEFEFSSLGGGTLHGYRWEPAGEPVAVVQIIHGIAEHMLRYDEFARFLNAHGVLVVAEDHMGHGKSEGTRLYFSGGWETAAEDCYTLLTRTHEEFPQLPYFLFGHSMGSFLTRTILIRHPDAPLAGAVICGTGCGGAGRGQIALRGREAPRGRDRTQQAPDLSDVRRIQ